MLLHVFCYLFFIAIVNAQKSSIDERLIILFGNSSDFIPAGYEAVPKAPLEALIALPKCGEGADKGKKVCIVYHRCDATTNTVTPEEVINTTGEGLIDIREGANECEHHLDVCCKLPEGGELPTTTTTTLKPIDPTAPPPPLPQPSFCGIRNEAGLDFKIQGNTNEAEYGEFPWMLVILKLAYNQAIDKTPFICGASLIAPSVVLTGAHCVNSYQNQLDQIKIRAGEWDALSEKERIPYQERAVKRIIIHKDFNTKTLVNNIALLILELPFTKAENIGTLCLPENNQEFNAKDCIGSGWGQKEFGDKEAYSAILKKLQLPIVPRDRCQVNLRTTRLGAHFLLDPSFLCAGGQEGVDTCKGDGGSPLVCRDPRNSKRYVQVGMVAWGIGCGEKDIPGVYVNVPRYRNWIDQQVSGLGLSNKPYTV